MAPRQEATGEDASEVIEIMRSSMVDTFSDEIGTLDISMGINGSGMSKVIILLAFQNLIIFYIVKVRNFGLACPDTSVLTGTDVEIVVNSE